MPDTKITALTAISTVNPATYPLTIVDTADTTMAASGTTKKITVNQILGAGGTATLASATITGDLTVRTSKLQVTSTGVGFGMTPITPFSGVVGTTGAVFFRTTDPAAPVASPYIQAPASTGFSSISPVYGFWYQGCGIGNPALNNVSVITDSTERYRIASDGVATWSNVGGVAGTAMTLNANGLGIGVTPSAWQSSVKALQLGGAALSSFSTYVGFLTSNAYNDGAWKFVSAQGASRYEINANVHSWHVSNNTPSIGGAITFTQAMTLDASGNLLVGTTSLGVGNANAAVIAVGSNAGQIALGHVSGTASGQNYANFLLNSVTIGSITQNGTTGVLYNITSDYRLKESVQPLVGGLARVNALKPSVYKWKSDGSNGEGFLAHELAEVVPFAVSGEKDAVNEDGSIKAQGIDMSRVVPILVAAIQELTARVETLETR